MANETPLSREAIRLFQRGGSGRGSGVQFFPTTLVQSEPATLERVVAFPPEGARQVSAMVDDGISVRDVAARCAFLWEASDTSAFVTSLAKAILIRSHRIGRITPDPPYRLVDWKPGARLILPMDYSEDRRVVMLAPRRAIEYIAGANAERTELNQLIIQRTVAAPVERAWNLTRNDLYQLIQRNPPDANALAKQLLAGASIAASNLVVGLFELISVEDLDYLAVAPSGQELIQCFKSALGPGPATPSPDPHTRARYMVARLEGVRESLSPGQIVLAALDKGTIRINTNDERVLRDSIEGKQSIIVHSAIVEMLASFVSFGSVDVLSMYRRGESQHGVVQGSRVLVNAIDISGLGGTQVDFGKLSKPKMVPLVASMIKLLPNADFDLGFPRPIGGPTGFDPTNDVFFSVPDLATAGMCWAGTIARRLDQMLNTGPARAQDNIRAAMQASRARFHVMYPDGVNHLHINITMHPEIVVTP